VGNKPDSENDGRKRTGEGVKATHMQNGGGDGKKHSIREGKKKVTSDGSNGESSHKREMNGGASHSFACETRKTTNLTRPTKNELGHAIGEWGKKNRKPLSP